MSYLDGRRSNFPYGIENNGIDEILELFDLPHSEKENALRYAELRDKEILSQEEQKEYNELSNRLQHYILTPETLNYFGDIIIRLQKFFKTDVEPYIENKKKEFQQEIDKFAHLEEWKPDTYYYKKNIVTSGGNAYIAKLDNINQPPPTEKYWGLIAEKGDKGEPSLNIHYRGEYDSAMAYVQGDAVVFGQKHKLWYYAKKNTQGNPPTNPEYWELQNNQSYIGSVEPFDKRISFWVDTDKTGLMKYYNESMKDYLPVKAGAIANNDGTNEYTPNQVKKIDEDLSDLIVKVGAVEKTLNIKVDKVAGKGLSTEDYTTKEKDKLANIEEYANRYVHPDTHSANIIVENTERRFVTDLEKSNWNAKETPKGAQAKVDLHANDTSNPHRVTASQLGAVTTSTFNSHVNDKVKHITSAERNRWNSQFRSRQIFVQGGQPPSSMVEKGDLWIW